MSADGALGVFFGCFAVPPVSGLATLPDDVVLPVFGFPVVVVVVVVVVLEPPLLLPFWFEPDDPPVTVKAGLLLV